MEPRIVTLDQALLVLRGLLDEATEVTVIMRYPAAASTANLAYAKLKGRLSHVSLDNGIHVRFTETEFLVVHFLTFLRFEYTASDDGDPTDFESGVRISFPLGETIDILRTKEK